MHNTLLSWRDNKIRWIMLFYVLGSIIGAYLMFFNELLFDSATMALAKVLIVVVFIPLATVLISVLAAVVSERGKRA